ncbi:Squalene/phytoene synthase [compost metagenome]
MRRHGYSQEELEAGVVNRQFVNMIEELRREALGWFEKGLAHVETYPPESGLAVELAAAFYAAILESVAEAGYDVFRHRAYVSDEAKLRMLGRTAARYASRFGDGQGMAAVL